MTNPISAAQPLFDAVLFDRDGTLVEDVPYNGSPEKVRPMPGAREALDRLRSAGLAVGVVTNQSGLARGYFTEDDLRRVNDRVEELLGPFGTWRICPHGPGGCGCRKPAPGLVRAAAADLRTTPARCVVVGDIGADMAAAGAAGAAGVLVPTPVTRPEEIAAAPAVATHLGDAVSQILARQALLVSRSPAPAGARVLVVRADSAGDVLVTGPAIRAVAARASRVVLLCGPRGRDSAALLPGVDEIVTWDLPWISPTPAPVAADGMAALVERLAGLAVDEALIFTSFHQSPLPLALLLRMAGVRRISAISDDYPGSLLDVRHRVPLGIPEPERALSLAAAAGYPLPAGDEPVLRLRPTTPDDRGYVVVHPGASVPARAAPPEVCAAVVAALAEDGHRVLVTGGPDETALTAAVAGDAGVDLGGRISWERLAAIVAGADCLMVGNTGPAHLAAATGTPVVSLFAPTVGFGAWAPYRVPWVRLGDAGAPCRDTRATTCPVPDHPCLSTVDPAAVVGAVRLLTGGPA